LPLRQRLIKRPFLPVRTDLFGISGRQKETVSLLNLRLLWWDGGRTSPPLSDFYALLCGDGDITDCSCDFPTNFAPYLAHFPLSFFLTFRLLLVYLSFTCRLPFVYLPRPTSLQPAELNLPFEPSVNTVNSQLTQISPCRNTNYSPFKVIFLSHIADGKLHL
jgi:hypothetical protein